MSWREDQWIAACIHILRCDQKDNCRFCDRIKKQIADEQDHHHARMEDEGGIPQ